ncbi:MAG: hypothetical protein QOE09_1505 [Ilumatobacteraceae bacterium]|jgi:hypothetical protein
MTSVEAQSRATRGVDQTNLLRIYLRDHEAAAAGGLQLVRRCWKANQGTAYAPDLQRLTMDIRSDRDAFRRICRHFDVKYSNVRRGFAVAGATLGRLKLNGRLTSYSPLSRVIELEALSGGVMTKLRLWESLELVADDDHRLDRAALKALAAEANEQLDVLRKLHDMAAVEAFG